MCSISGVSQTGDVNVQGAYAYVVTTEGLHIVNVSNPALPVLLSTYRTGGASWVINGSEGFLYVGNLGGGAKILYHDSDEWTPPIQTGPRTYRIERTIQDGNWTLSIGSAIHDLSGNAMDQDADGIAGEADDTFTFNFRTPNQKPIVEVGTDKTLGKNVSFGRIGHVTDDDIPENLAGTVDWGDGSAIENLAIESDGSFGFGHSWSHGGLYKVKVNVEDADGANATDEFIVRVDPALLGDTWPFDGTVNFSDLNNVLSHYGKRSVAEIGDTSPFDGIVNFADLNVILSNYGKTEATTSATASLQSQLIAPSNAAIAPSWKPMWINQPYPRVMPWNRHTIAATLLGNIEDERLMS
jgi:hypothetical protein